MEYNKKDFIRNRINQFYKNKKKSEIAKEKSIELRKDSVINRIFGNQANRIKKHLNLNKFDKEFKYNQFIGCTKKELEIYLSEKLKDGMTFENYGEWEVDHIIPISSFDLSKHHKFFECFNYKNLQPLWKIENRSKSNKIVET